MNQGVAGLSLTPGDFLIFVVEVGGSLPFCLGEVTNMLFSPSRLSSHLSFYSVLSAINQDAVSSSLTREFFFWLCGGPGR